MTHRTPRHAAALLAVAAALCVTACAPRARALAGAPTPASFPRAELSPGHHQVTFDWRYEDEDLSVNGEGVVRIASPDSARLDLFVAGGMGGGTVFLVGDHLDAPGPGVMRRLIPPAPLLWAAFGRLALPPAADTVARIAGDTLRADVGHDEVWRATFVGGRLSRVERLSDGRIREHVSLATRDSVRYDNDGVRRSLTIHVTRRADVPPFDLAIWHR